MRHGFLFGLSSSLIIGIIAAGKSDLAALLSVLDRILAKYPDYSDGYFIRAFALCAGNDRERALKSIDTSRVGKDSLGSLLSMRAKLEHTNGDYVAAVDDLDKAIRSDVTKATEFTNSSAVAPEKTASICTWTVSDMDAIVRRFPADYRSYLFRGLYFGKFAPLNEESLKPAIDNLSKAAELNSNSALTHFFKAEILRNYFFFRRLSKGDAARDQMDHELLGEYDKALSLDADLVPALKGRALARFHLKQFQKAIEDYDKILSLNPQDVGAYEERGLAKMQLGRSYEAISDFSALIKTNTRKLMEYGTYEIRADAYIARALSRVSDGRR